MNKNWLKILIFAFLTGAVIWAGKGIFKYSVFSTHDGNHHISRVYDAIEGIKEGEFPLRWSGSLNYFCGAPIFNFFYPLIYYLAVAINFLTRDVIFTLKLIDFGSLFLGTVFFYLWIKSETEKTGQPAGRKLAAITGALTYLYAPYRFSLIFVRGSPEFLAYAILPVVLWFYSLLFKTSGKKFIFYAFLASLAGAFLTISHNFTVMFLMPIILAYLILKMYLDKTSTKNIIWIFFTFIASFGMGSFFIGPAIFEQKFTKIGHNFLEWRDHFPTFWQTVKSDWGYFYSSSGIANDGMSFMLGYAQWLMLGIGFIFLIYVLFKHKLNLKKFLNENAYILFFLFISAFSVYLLLPISIPVWEKIRPLQEIQFSWRLLGVAVFAISAMFSYLLAKIKSGKIYFGLAIFISVFTIFGTRNFMLPQPVSVEDIGKYSDFEKLHPHRHSTTTMGDDVLSPNAGGSCWFTTKPVTSDKDEKIDFNTVERGNNFGTIKFSLNKDRIKGDKIVFNLGYFPEIYKINLNGNILSEYSDCGGLVCFDKNHARAGMNMVTWNIGESRTEKLFDGVSLGFFALWLLILLAGLTKIGQSKKGLMTVVFLTLTFLVFIFFRSYNLSGRVGFGWDQERDAFAATNILAGKLTLLGPRVQGPAGFFLPPYFFYILTPFYVLWNLSPFATTGFIFFWSVLFFGVGFWTISKVFDKKTALFFLILWAVNPLSVSVDTIAWNPVAIPLLFLMLIYFNHLYFKYEKLKYAILIGLTFGLGMSFHLQFLFIAPLLIPFFLNAIRDKKIKQAFAFLISTTLPFIPIVIFDLRHNFLNLKQILSFVNSQGVDINRVLPVWERASSFMIGTEPSKILGIAVYFLVLIETVILARETKDEIQRKIIFGLGLVWGFSLPLFYVFIKNPSEYYFNYLLVPLLVLAAIAFKKLKHFGIFLLFGTVIYFSFSARPLLNNVALSLREKDKTVYFLKQVTKNSSPFNISFDVPFNEDAGFRYLLKYHKVNYSGDSKDPLIELIIPGQKRPVTFLTDRIGIFIPPAWLKNNWLSGSK